MAETNRIAAVIRLGSIVVFLAIGGHWTSLSASPGQSAAEMESLLARIGERVTQF
jgi:hypothetical protein